MSIPDEMIGKYYRLASTLSVDEVDAIDAALADGSANPYELKRALAVNIVDAYHGAGAGEEAKAAFDRVFKQDELPEDIAEVEVDLTPNDQGMVYLAGVLKNAGLAPSVSEARRLIDGGGVKIDQQPVEPKAYNIAPDRIHAGSVLQVGKRKFARIK